MRWWLVLLICTITVTRNLAAQPNGRFQRCRGPCSVGSTTGSAFVGKVVTGQAENDRATAEQLRKADPGGHGLPGQPRHDQRDNGGRTGSAVCRPPL
jgi:hypothetical protein